MFKAWSQLQQSLLQYQVYRDGVLTDTYMEELTMRWYGRDEMAMMLESVGFAIQAWYGDYTFEQASDHHETFIVHALKK